MSTSTSIDDHDVKLDSVIENDDLISIANLIDSLPSNHHTISPLTFLKNNNSLNSETETNILLILNQKINIHPLLFKNIWNSSTLRICADGGLDRLNEYNDSYIPDYVVGDLDSVTNRNLNFYSSIGTNIILQSSQFYMDFTKAVSVAKVHLVNKNFLINLPDTIDSVEKYVDSIDFPKINDSLKFLILGGIGGRFDQTLQIISQVYQNSIIDNTIQFALLNSEHNEIIHFLKKGINFINYPKFNENNELEIFGNITTKSKPNLRNVGILPLTSPAIISTNGLKWDVINWSTSITTKVSSSNLQVAKEGFIIETNQPIFINLEL
ncbi:hypothetical protein CANINC_003548 [Pichia inconspicua]|uniref:Thiamine pyrophosphokinase n=1 Tax=Pichia inconspicua TaxID=52247 RepID=A0A4T0WZL7_9ASCO|nr:hypothetical protein CANINC_003548 [[Candida] inconspicua]